MTTDITKNPAIEKVVLGAILLNEENFWDVNEILSMDLFSSEDHQKIYLVMNELALDARAIRPHIVAGRIGSLSDGQDCEAYLSMLLHVASKEENLPLRDYAFELRSAATRRRVIALAEKMIQTANNPKADADQIVDRASERLADISRDAKIEFESTVSSTIAQIVKTASESQGKGIALAPCLRGLEEMIGFFPPGSLVLWGGGPGSGKRLCIDTPVPTPSGFTTMGALKVGDEIFSQDGTVTKVTGVSPILMAERSFKVVFNTGEEILADGDHLWKTMTKAERKAALRRTDAYRAKRRQTRASRAVENSSKPWTSEMLKKRNAEMQHNYLDVPTGGVRNTDEIRETLMVGKHMNHSVDVCGALDLPHVDLPIEPYLFGLWLGDGSASKGTIGMSSADWDLILPHVDRKVRSWREELPGQHNRITAYKDISFDGLRRDLKDLGVLDNKHIPTIYLRASVEQRLALLQGLMDTDGTCCARSGSSTLCLSDERLIRDAHHLVSTLGIKATICTRTTTHKDRHDVKFTTDLPVFRMKRKLDRQKRDVLRPVVGRRYIVAIEPVEPRLMRCISVEHPDRTYLVGQSCIATHNTAMAMQQLLFTSTADPCSLFELEMENTSLVARSVAGDTGVKARDIMRGLTDNQFESLVAAQQKFASRQLRIVAPSKMDINQIRSRAYAHKRKFGLRMLAVDHLKLVERHTKGRMDPVERAYENARDLKSLAKDLGCVVIALCQFTKAARQKETPEPEMEDFYGGSLEEHADLMLANFNRHEWLKKNPPRTNQPKAKEDHQAMMRMHEGRIEVYKLKDRFGTPRDRRVFHWDGATTRYSDIGGYQTALDFADMPDLEYGV